MGANRARGDYRARLRWAFVFALAVHTGAALALRLAVTSHRLAVAPRPPPDELIVLSEEAPPPVPIPVSVTEAPEATRAASRLERKAAVHPNDEGPAEVAPVDSAPSPAANPSAQPSPLAVGRGAPVELGIGAYWKRVALAPGPAPAASEPPPDVAPPPGRILLDALENGDLQRGLGRGGPLVSAAHEAASLPIAPDVGAVTLLVEAGADGKVVSAKVVAAAGEDVGAWRDVARELVSLLASKRLRIPPGAHGYRAVLQITAERTLPSGEKRSVSPGGVPDEACSGEGIHRKCFEHGLPLGISGTWGDLSNIGQKPVHVVHARVLDEKTF